MDSTGNPNLPRFLTRLAEQRHAVTVRLHMDGAGGFAGCWLAESSAHHRSVGLDEPSLAGDGGIVDYVRTASDNLADAVRHTQTRLSDFLPDASTPIAVVTPTARLAAEAVGRQEITGRPSGR